MEKTGEYIRKIINSNLPAYIFLFILTAALIIDTAMIAVSIAAYAISGNAANLENITTYALIISFASTVNVYLIKKIIKEKCTSDWYKMEEIKNGKNYYNR